MSKTKMYVIEETKSYSWNKAFEECKQMGMDLFSVKSEEEFRILKEYIKEEYGRLKPFWLGALKKNGHFKWTSTGESIKQFMWHAGEPNYKNANELCIHTWEGNFQWNDNDCRIELPFICDLEI